MGVIRKKTARSAEGGVKYVCDVCVVDITSTVRIRCAHPDCHEYDLCVKCFSSGESSKAHQPATHAYRVIEQNSFPIFERDWGADEELLLLEGAEIYGLGSWADIADHIGGFRHKDEVRDHYLSVYVDSSKFPLPERCSPLDMALTHEVSREEFQARKKQRVDSRRDTAKNPQALLPKTKPTASVPACHEIQGYMPGRLEFETEHANEAEEAVQLMQFDPGDGINPRTGELEPEMELKLTVMSIYNDRLTQRVERKKVIFEHRLLEYRENSKLEKKRSKEEKDLLNRAKPFARIMHCRDFEDFCQGLVDELNLRQAIAQLQEWRTVGIGDLASGDRYEHEKAQRAQKAMPLGSMDRERLAASQRGGGRQQVSQDQAPSVASLLVSTDLPVYMPPVFGSHTAAAASSSNPTTTTDTKPAPALSSSASGPDPPPLNNTLTTTLPHRPSNPPILPAPPPPRYPLPLATQPLPNVQLLPLTPSVAPDLALLTPEEARLCEVLRLQPKPYIMIKEQIIKEALKGNGSLKRKRAKEISGLESNKGSRLFEFLVDAGWVVKA